MLFNNNQKPNKYFLGFLGFLSSFSFLSCCVCGNPGTWGWCYRETKLKKLTYWNVVYIHTPTYMDISRQLLNAQNVRLLGLLKSTACWLLLT